MRLWTRKARVAGMLAIYVIAVSATGCVMGQTPKLRPVAGRNAILTLWGMGRVGLFPEAREMGVKELYSFSCDPGRLAVLVKEGAKHGIAVYGCVTPLVGKELPRQQMNAEENAFRARILADKTRDKDHYQFGGEPYHPFEVLDLNINCFHHKSVRDAVKKNIRGVVMVEGITGVAFDFFGYDNYRCCRCPFSVKLAREYHRDHPEMSEQEARDAFSLESLVNFNNEMADYARSLKPGIKVACHVHPVFLPQLHYGRRLKLDICCQTAAWFFRPYWSRERIEEHVGIIFGAEKEYWPFAEGAALLGTTCTDTSSHTPKTPERIEFELRTMLAAGADRIQVCSGGDLMTSPPHMAVFRRVFSP